MKAVGRRAARFLGAVAVMLLVAPAAAKKDEDPAAVRAEVRKEIKDASDMPFLDLSYKVLRKELGGDARWAQVDPPPVQAPSEESGPQLYLTWDPRQSAEGGWVVEVLVTKLPHKRREGNTVSQLSVAFDRIGKSVLTSEHEKLLEATYEDWKKGAKEVSKADCVEPRGAAGAGPGDEWASCTGTDPDTGKRERRDWYVWKKGDATWLVRVRYDGAMLGEKKVAEKGKELMKALREVDDRRL